MLPLSTSHVKGWNLFVCLCFGMRLHGMPIDSTQHTAHGHALIFLIPFSSVGTSSHDLWRSSKLFMESTNIDWLTWYFQCRPNKLHVVPSSSFLFPPTPTLPEAHGFVTCTFMALVKELAKTAAEAWTVKTKVKSLCLLSLCLSPLFVSPLSLSLFVCIRSSIRGVRRNMKRGFPKLKANFAN